MITGDLVECNDTGSLGVVTKVIDNVVYDDYKSRTYKVFWMLEAIATYVSPQGVKKIPFNSDDTLDSSYCVSTF